MNGRSLDSRKCRTSPDRQVGEDEKHQQVENHDGGARPYHRVNLLLAAIRGKEDSVAMVIGVRKSTILTSPYRHPTVPNGNFSPLIGTLYRIDAERIRRDRGRGRPLRDVRLLTI